MFFCCFRITYERQSNENQTPATKWQWTLFYSKVTARSVYIFTTLRDETISSSLVERGRSLMIPQPHPLLHFLGRKKPTSTNDFLHQKCGSHKGKHLGCTEDVQEFPSQIFEAYPSPDWQYGDGRYHTKGWFHRTTFQGVLTVWRLPTSSVTKKRTTPHCSSLLASISNAGRTHSTQRSPPEQ